MFDHINDVCGLIVGYAWCKFTRDDSCDPTVVKDQTKNDITQASLSIEKSYKVLNELRQLFKLLVLFTFAL